MSKLNKYIEEALLIILIAMNVFELIGILPGTASFFKAVLSFTAIAYVFYKASLSEIFFGEKNTSLDLALIISYFLLIVNKFVQFFLVSIHEEELLQGFFMMVIDNYLIIEKVSFLIGSFCLILIAYHVTHKINFKEPSVLSILHGENFKNAKKFFSILIVICGFFIIMFNPLMEWFTLLLDSPLVVLVFFTYIFKIHNMGKKMDQEEILYKIAESVDEFIDSFIKLFHDKNTIFFGISALLVLHLVTDAYAFIIPYAFSNHNIYSELEGSHMPLGELFSIEKIHLALGDQIILLFSYIFNVLALLLLMLIPAFMWYTIHTSKKEDALEEKDVPGLLIAFFYFCLSIFIMMPAFKIISFSNSSELKNLIGVDIQTRGILTENLSLFFYIAIGIYIIVLVLTLFEKIKNILGYLASMIGLGFFGVYLYLYFKSIVLFYIDFTLGLWNYDILNLYIMCFYILFTILLALFYIGGYLGFAIEVFND